MNSNYSELTNSYMEVFLLDKFNKFLNTTQNGAAQFAVGMPFSVLFKSICSALSLCVVQLSFFCLLRPYLKDIYQPRCYCVPQSELMQKLPPGFFEWIIPTLKHSISHYISIGLDAYFFIRFVHIILLLFIVVGTLNILVLVPINWTARNSNGATHGLDKLSLSNIGPNQTGRLKYHFLMALITILLFHLMMVYELQSYVKIRQAYLFGRSHKMSVSSSTILIKHVPKHLRSYDAIKNIFADIPHGIKNIWFVYDYTGISEAVKSVQNTLKILEASELANLKSILRNKEMDGSPSFYPPISSKYFRIPFTGRRLHFKIPGVITKLIRFKPVNQREWCLQQLIKSMKHIDDIKLALVEGKLEKHSSVFIRFESQTGAYVAHQCLLSGTQGQMNNTIVEVNAKDILWGNLVRSDNEFVLLIESFMVTITLVCIIVGYVVPVSFIGFIFQMPKLVKVMPFLKSVNILPRGIAEVIITTIPSILLSLLTTLVSKIFRWLMYLKGCATGCELELELQRWYFVFLFVQQFLVLTILSSIMVVLRQIINHPTSIPVCLATTLPKAANFFFQYIAVKALAFCGNSFLQIDQLLLKYTLFKWKDRTPRSKFFRFTTLPNVSWGSVYPVVTMYAIIGLVYSVISPMINVFVVLILGLFIIYYKYALRYIYNHVNVSESHGRLYPVALFQLYLGIYCLQTCLIGIFFMLKDETGIHRAKSMGWTMTVVLLLTIFSNWTLYNRYVPYFSTLPIMRDANFKHGLNGTQAFEYELLLNMELLFLHPSFGFEKPSVWLPLDNHGHANTIAQKLQESTCNYVMSSTSGSTISKRWFFFTVSVSLAPPDYK